jgi:hypothetical protein
MRTTPEQTGVPTCYCLPRCADVTVVLPFIHYKPSSMRIISFVIALLMCCNLLQAQDQKAARAAGARKAFRVAQQDQVRTHLYKRMQMSTDVQTKVEKIMSDFMATVEQQQANPGTLTKKLMNKTMADRDKRLRLVLGTEGMKQFLAYERQLPPVMPQPQGMKPKFSGN